MNKLVSIATLTLSVAALAVAIANRAPAPVAAPPAEEAPAKPDGKLRALERRVELLEETSGYLERKLFELGQRPTAVATDGAVAAAPSPSFAEPLRPPPPLPPAGSPARAELKDAVRAVQEELAAEQRQARIDRLQAELDQAAPARQERWKRFVGEAHLDYPQEQELNKRLDAEAARRKAAVDDMRAGAKSFVEGRLELREARQETDRAMAQVLKPEQLKQFNDLRRDERREEGRGGRPRGAGPEGPPTLP